MFQLQSCKNHSIRNILLRRVGGAKPIARTLLILLLAFQEEPC
ncbi:hypothetical protein E2320_017149 [Naja naja]|nr:hypothetical protein E2320_017149 [Naja naja]